MLGCASKLDLLFPEDCKMLRPCFVSLARTDIKQTSVSSQFWDKLHTTGWLWASEQIQSRLNVSQVKTRQTLQRRNSQMYNCGIKIRHQAALVPVPHLVSLADKDLLSTKLSHWALCPRPQVATWALQLGVAKAAHSLRHSFFTFHRMDIREDRKREKLEKDKWWSVHAWVWFPQIKKNNS